MTGDQVFPQVSVVIPSCDRPELLARAVASIVAQDYPGDIECIVVFDQCEERLPDFPLRDDRVVRGMSNLRSIGLAGARNTGILSSNAELIAFCDDDDFWLPQKLSHQVPLLTGHQHNDVVVNGVRLRNGKRTFDRLPPGTEITSRLLESARTSVHPSTLLARRTAFTEEPGLVDEEIPGSYGEDRDWLLRASYQKPLAALQEVMTVVEWGHSKFQRDWSTIVKALTYLMKKHPALVERDRARMQGRLAFACAAAGDKAAARHWAVASLKGNWRQPQPYAALAVSMGLASPDRLVQMAGHWGRGL